jgi:hypothetical protein
MLKKRISKWNLDKKRKHADMLAALRIALEREAQGKSSVFLDRGRLVTFEDIKYYFTRRGVHDLHAVAAAQIASTSEPLITCHTPPAAPIASDTTGLKLVDALDLNQLLRHGSSGESNLASAARPVSSSPKADMQTQIVGHLATPPNHLEKLLMCTGNYFDSVFENSNWYKENSAFDLHVLDSFYHYMLDGHDLLIAGNGTLAFKTFDCAFSLVRDILKKHILLFLPYVYHMMALFGGLREQRVTSRLLEFIGQMTEIYYSHSHPIKQVVTTLGRMSPGYRAFSAYRVLQSTLEQMKIKTEPMDRGHVCRSAICQSIDQEKRRDSGAPYPKTSNSPAKPDHGS